MRSLRRIAGAALLAVAVVIAVTGSSPAATDTYEKIKSYDVDITIQPNGDLLVRETIVYFFNEPRHGIYRDILDRVDYTQRPNHDRVYPIDVISVRASEGTPADYDVSSEGDFLRIKIGDPDREITGDHTYEITYRVRGALNGFQDHDELVWNAVGDRWPVPIGAVHVAVHAPAAITAVNCAEGEYGSNQPCGSASADGDTATFTAKQVFDGWSLGPFQGMTVTVALPKGAVPDPKPILEERFTLASAFRVTPSTGGLSVGLLVLLVLGVLGSVWFVGRDRRYKGSAVDAAFDPGVPDAPEERVPLFGEHETPVEFAPPGNLRPGQVGTLVDFHANPLDVTATIVDLAVRGYLVISEVEPEGKHFASGDWKFTRKKQDDDALLPYEKDLLDGLFRDGDEVRLSELRYEFAGRMSAVIDELQRDAQQRGWFAQRVGTGGCAFVVYGILLVLLGIGLTIGLAIATHAALVGLPVIVGGIVMIVAAHWAPRRTAKGYAVLRHVDGFRRFIEESEKQRAQFAEKKNLFTEYLPFAIVFGATEKWAHAFAGLGAEPPDTSSWYVSSGAFDYTAFSGAIDSFTVASAGTLTSTPPSTSSSSGSSGFSGGGFSGGGGGGGGGGSW
ncbi:MAG TPA: DUF2207 domain-containing protein [Acidimicrobiia bacterium]|nr:DUF2207 domain-containing protein [Acidimicrobiia bacterium]